ncbi:molecular chaperone DnaJ [Changpingibacter yushuensis]|uniref:molecular chaperone DnaJ n=1 Tax=Changpingibacter yushuensis TaxID=2758440 RepID=UPI0015F67B11|nr:molecular chaperone DnaJ [Changpingibacter yushuensis]
MADYYATLGVSRDASQDEIKKAYRKLARKLHPDVAGPDKAEEFKSVNEAYDILSNEEQRRMYDMGGEEALRGGGAGGGYGAFQDIFDSFFGGMGGTANRGPVPRGRRGQDTLVALELELEDVVFGADKMISQNLAVECQVCHGSCAEPGTEPITCAQCNGTGSIQRVTNSILGRVVSQSVCPTCHGHGTVIVTPCHECAGEGRVRANKTINIKVPAGVEDGMRIRLTGQGDAGIEGGPAGDLFAEVRLRQHPVFQRSGDDLICELQVPMTTASLGTSVTIDTLDGPKDITIPAGTQSGHVVILSGFGVGRLHRPGRGDLRVGIAVKTPSKIDEAQRELLEKLAQLRGENIPTASLTQQNSSFFSKIRDKFAAK